jgi:DNA-binding LytR/AlgR family response regulator
LARELLKSYVARTPDLELEGCYASPMEGVKAVLSGTLDFIFLDINMPCIDGIEFGEIVPHETRIIYVTAYEQYALRGYKVNALDYLLKPVAYADFLKAVGKAAEWCAMRSAMQHQNDCDKNFIVVKSDYKSIQFPIDSIKYIEVQRDYLSFYLDNSDTPIVSLMNLKTLEQMLRSYIVHLNKIEVVDRNRVVFGNVYLPISDSYRPQFVEFMKKRTP